MVPISEGKGDPGKGLVRGGGGCQFTPVTHVLVFMATGVCGHREGEKKKQKKKRMSELSAQILWTLDHLYR